jgi:hypothetical protein
MHGSIGASFIVGASNLIVVTVTSNFTTVASNSVEVHMQQLTFVQT